MLTTRCRPSTMRRNKNGVSPKLKITTSMITSCIIILLLTSKNIADALSLRSTVSPFRFNNWTLQQKRQQREPCCRNNQPILYSTKEEEDQGQKQEQQEEQPGQFSKTNLNEIRGNRYGISNNSTILSPSEAANAVNVEPPLEVPKKKWQRAWRLHKRLLKVLHFTDGRETRLEDSSLNVACLWWKALAANNKTSPVYDDSLSYDLLPSLTRRLISPKVLRFYPRLHHANVEIRTAFLDQTLTSIIHSTTDNDNNNNMTDEHQQQKTQTPTKKIRLLCMGSGYDPRSIKFLERGLITDCWEFDLPDVVKAKERLYYSKRFRKRRPWLFTTTTNENEKRKDDNMQQKDKKNLMEKLHFVPADLNRVEDVKEKLDAILKQKNNDKEENEWYNIFVFEGVMIYLDETVPSALLSLCSNALKDNHARGSLCFADRLENIPGGDEALAIEELERNGWRLERWLPKPGLARHMGFAVPL